MSDGSSRNCYPDYIFSQRILNLFSINVLCISAPNTLLPVVQQENY